MPTNSYVPTIENLKGWYMNGNKTEEELKEQQKQYIDRLGFSMTDSDLNTTNLITGRQVVECRICEKQIASGMISVGHSYHKICPTCAKTYLSSFIKSLEKYKQIVNTRLDEINKVDVDEWNEKNKTKLMLGKLKNG